MRRAVARVATRQAIRLHSGTGGTQRCVDEWLAHLYPNSPRVAQLVDQSTLGLGLSLASYHESETLIQESVRRGSTRSA